MSELMNTHDHAVSSRAGFLATVSSIALLSCMSAMGSAEAYDDADHLIVWIELGGQMERMNEQPELFLPPFFSKGIPAVQAAMIEAQKPPPFSNGFDGKISFTPEDSDWVFSAAIRFGKSGTVKHLHYQSAGPASAYVVFFGQYSKRPFAAYADAHTGYAESHAVLDFQAGKDVGLGLFGEQGHSVISAGVRFAQFSAHSHATSHVLPTYHLTTFIAIPSKNLIFRKGVRHHYAENENSSRNAKLFGPSLSWNASASLAGSDTHMSLDFDWGVNGAILFGRQKAHTDRQTSGCYSKGVPGSGVCPGSYSRYPTRHYVNPPVDHARARTVVVPNGGAFAGFSLNVPNAKASIGYRADFFLSAMDGGIDAAHRENIGFYGPFATVSIGIGG
jgi:hypothetical protein